MARSSGSSSTIWHCAAAFFFFSLSFFFFFFLIFLGRGRGCDGIVVFSARKGKRERENW